MIPFLEIILDNNIKLYVKADQAYTCNLQPWVTIFWGSYLILRIALYHFWRSFLTTILNYTWKLIRLTRVICNHELQSFEDPISFCALHYVDIFITWHILHVLHIYKYIISWRVNGQTWRCQLRVWISSVVIK